MRTVYLCLSAVLAFGGMLLSTHDVSAELATAETLAMSCTIPNLGTAEAGLPGQPFPRVVQCPGADCSADLGLVGQFARWDFTFTYTVNPSQAALQVAADVAIEQTIPTATITTLGVADSSLKVGGGDFDSKWLRYNANATRFSAAYFTKNNVIPRIEGAGAKSGNTSSFCKLAGAGTTVGSSAEAVPLSAISQVGPCTVNRIVDGRGCVVSLSLINNNGGSCVLTDDTIVSGAGKQLAFTKCENVTHSFNGSCSYCYVTSTGTLKCVTDTSVASCPK
jgi:hypothetical protein